MEGMTERQVAVLRFVHRRAQDDGLPPTVREIGAELKVGSTKVIHDSLKALEQKGYLARSGKTSRGLRITAEGRLALGLDDKKGRTPDDTVLIPIVGNVAAGAPILAEENYQESVRVDSKTLGGAGKDIFGLRIRGDSMIGDGILDGDVVFVRQTSTARSGAIVIALIDQDATCKRFYPEGDQVRLQPSNPKHAPIFLRQSDFRTTMILGVVVAVQRRVEEV